MITYQDAHHKFTNTNKPPRSKKYADNQRPLRRVSESHLMIQRDAHSYVYKINGVEVARYFDPNEDGEYEVAVRGLYGTYDINLMWKFTGLFSNMSIETNTGDKVRVPLNPRYNEQDKEFSALLVYDKDDKLIVEKSWHADVYRLASSKDDKDTRKELKKELDAYVTLQLFKLPSLRVNAKLSSELGRPFGESDLGWSIQSSMRDALSNRPLPLESQSFMETFDQVAQDCFNMLASKRVYNADDNLFYKARGYYARNNDPAMVADAEEAIEDIANEITPDEFKKSLVTRIMSFAGLAQGTQSVPLGQFPNTLPRRYYLVAKK